MKTKIVQFFFLTLFILTSCKKDNVEPKSQFIDTPFSILDFKSLADTAAIEINYPGTITLKSDSTWVL